MNSIIELINSQEVTLWNSIYKLVLSLLLGGLIGLERRQRGQVAGMRTFALISMGATLAMLVSIYIPQEYLGLKNGDPGRVAAQVISGIGFLGAGAIIQMKGSVRGLTTAAGLWMTACIGLAIGTGMYVVGTVAAVLILLVLRLLDRLEHKLLNGREQKIIRVKVKGIVENLEPYRQCVREQGIRLSEEYLRYDYDGQLTTFNMVIRCADTTDFSKLFSKIHEQGDVASVTLSNEVNN